MACEERTYTCKLGSLTLSKTSLNVPSMNSGEVVASHGCDIRLALVWIDAAFKADTFRLFWPVYFTCDSEDTETRNLRTCCVSCWAPKRVFHSASREMAVSISSREQSSSTEEFKFRCIW